MGGYESRTSTLKRTWKLKSRSGSLPASFADVAVPFPLFQTFTYSVPEPIRNGLAPGCRVLVPFGNRYLIGLTTKVHHKSRPGKVKPVRQILDLKPLLSPAMLKLGLWMASYYLAPPGEALRVMLPPGGESHRDPKKT